MVDIAFWGGGGLAVGFDTVFALTLCLLGLSRNLVNKLVHMCDDCSPHKCMVL